MFFPVKNVFSLKSYLRLSRLFLIHSGSSVDSGRLRTDCLLMWSVQLVKIIFKTTSIKATAGSEFANY